MNVQSQSPPTLGLGKESELPLRVAVQEEGAILIYLGWHTHLSSHSRGGVGSAVQDYAKAEPPPPPFCDTHRSYDRT